MAGGRSLGISTWMDNQPGVVRLAKCGMHTGDVDVKQRVEAHDEPVVHVEAHKGWAAAQHDTGCQGVVSMLNKEADRLAHDVRLRQDVTECWHCQRVSAMEIPTCSRATIMWYVMSKCRCTGSSNGCRRVIQTAQRVKCLWRGHCSSGLIGNCCARGTRCPRIPRRMRRQHKCLPHMRICGPSR